MGHNVDYIVDFIEADVALIICNIVLLDKILLLLIIKYIIPSIKVLNTSRSKFNSYQFICQFIRKEVPRGNSSDKNRISAFRSTMS